MDYAPQEIGVYDTVHGELTETECRSCHGNDLADRHHLTDTVLVDRLCTPCHDVIAEPPFVLAVRACLTSGCHSEADLQQNGWHHATNLADSGNCVACHDPNLIEIITPIRDFDGYPPTIFNPPSPYSCENCHWEQQLRRAADPGHPSTFDHYDAWDNFVGFFEYLIPISAPFDTHHMGFVGEVALDCVRCHSANPNTPSWDPWDPELIRYCEICHSPEKLHGIEPHVLGTSGWGAVGYHTPTQNPDDPCKDKKPTEYRDFSADEMCLGCHGDQIPGPPPGDDCTNNVPTMDTSGQGIQPNAGACGAIVVLRGDNFNEEAGPERKVQMKLKKSTEPWINLPVYSWTDTLIEVEIPCWTFNPGNYRVRVKTECGNSNAVTFTLKDWISATSITPDHGPCGLWLTIEGDSFANRQSRIFTDGYHGIEHLVDVVSGQGVFTALRYRNWSDTSFEVRFRKFFEDSVDPSTGERNFVQDDGSGACPNEPTMKGCEGLHLGPWSVYVKAVYYGDDDSSGDLSCGDTIFQVVSSEVQYYDLTNEMAIFRLNPDKIELGNRLKIYGINFGLSGGEVRIGTLAQAKDPTLGLGKLQQKIFSWSNTLIRLKVKGPSGWETKTKYVWVEKDGKKSNFEELKIVEP
jgi:hypothetical protein